MRLVSLNINGIRAGKKAGFFAWIESLCPDIVCLQEVRAGDHILNSHEFSIPGMYSYHAPATKSGYSGVAIYSKIKPQVITSKLNTLADHEGRYIEAQFYDLHIASIYFPSGSHKQERQNIKFDFLEKLKPFLLDIIAKGKKFILCGDFNIAHKKIDLKNWRSNQKSSGFLPEERAFLDWMFESIGWVDAFRLLNPHAEQYTWWSNFGNAYANNVGWRIDYQVTTPNLAPFIKEATVYKGEKFSDHAPLIIDYELPLVDTVKLL